MLECYFFIYVYVVCYFICVAKDAEIKKHKLLHKHLEFSFPVFSLSSHYLLQRVEVEFQFVVGFF